MRITAVIRTFNSAGTLYACLDSLRRQSIKNDVVVVDSGSSDSSIAIARQFEARVLEIEHDRYTPGRALNLGIDTARDAEVCLILSSHCALPHGSYLSEVARIYRAFDVEGTNGARRGPDGRWLNAPLVDRLWPHPENVLWGFSNHASSVRRTTWERCGFDERLDACEDKAWARRIHGEGGRLAYSPSLLVSSAHRRRAGLTSLYRRAYVEGLRCASLAEGNPVSVAATIWRHHMVSPRPGIPRAVQLIRPSRLTEAAGAARGIRRGLAAAVGSGQAESE